MANTIQIKRRTSAAGNQAGAPASLAVAELAFNEVDNTLYIGRTTGGSSPLTVAAIGGAGAFVSLSGTQTATGSYTFKTGTLTLDGTVTGTGISAYVTGKRLDEFAVPTAAVSLNSQNITNLAAPTSDAHAATKKYVDDSVAAATPSGVAYLSANNTFTGTNTFSASTTFATSVTTASSSFDVFNTGATTINAFGAAVSLSVGGEWGVNTSQVTFTPTGGGASSTTTKTFRLAAPAVSTENTALNVVIGPQDGATTGSIFAHLDINVAAGKKLQFADSVGQTVNFVRAAAGGNGTITIPVATGTLALTNNKLSAFATTTADELRGVISGTTGTGSLVFATNPALTTPNIGTPSAGTLTNCTGLPVSTGISGLGAGVATFLATPTSANLASALTDETGSNKLVFSTSPQITTSLTTDSTLFNLLNTTATTINAFGAATNITIGTGGTTGSTTFGHAINAYHGLTVVKDANFYNNSLSPLLMINTADNKVTAYGSLYVNTDEVATKPYVDAIKQGLDIKDSVRVATTANITLSGTQTIDGVSVIAGDRVLVKNQSTTSQNGIYVVAAGSWTRATDANTNDKVGPGLFVFVESGTANADTGWVLVTDGAVTLGTTGLTFSQFSSAGQINDGDGLVKVGSTISVGTASTGRIVVNADSIDLATVGTAGTYRSVTTDAYGRVTSGTNPTTFSGYGISDTSANLRAAISDETGTGALVFATSPTLVTPALGTPSSGTLTNCTGLPIAGIFGLGSGVDTALGTSTGGIGSFVVLGNELGTPSSGTLTNCSGLPVATGISGLGAGVATFLATPTSANLASALTDETGGSTVVFSNSPTLVTPNIGAATATSVNKVAITAPATAATLTIADGKTLTASNTLTFTGTDSSSVAFGAGGTVAYIGSNNAFTGANTFINSTGQTFRQAATQDGIIIRGRAGGTNTRAVTVETASLTANRTITLPDAAGTVLLDSTVCAAVADCTIDGGTF